MHKKSAVWNWVYSPAKKPDGKSTGVKSKDGKGGVRSPSTTAMRTSSSEEISFQFQILPTFNWWDKLISCFDARLGYWQTPVWADHQWLMAFVCDEGWFEWVRTPFGMKSSGSTFVWAIQQVLRPMKSFADSYVDDMTVSSDGWQLHLQHLTQYLHRIWV